MNLKNCFKNFTILTLILFLSVGYSLAQTNKSFVPRQEKLLNGLKVLTFSKPNADKVTLKLRIHSGSAFDRQDKEGTIALLGDILFPNEEAKDFFREDLGGSLEIEDTYDYIQITATSSSDQFLTMLETVANAVSNPQIDKENTAKVVSARLEKVKELEKTPSYVADLAVSKRLYGDFPYGRAQTGTSESLQKIDFADLIFARDRLLTPDNTTIAVVGSIKPELVNRAVRRYFGAWEKSDKKVPATFAQPEAPKTGLPVKNFPAENVSEYRIAFRNVARNNKDFYASKVLTNILQKRARMTGTDNVSVSQNPHLLYGSVVMSYSKWNLGKIQKNGNQISLPMTDSTVKELLEKPISDAEFTASKADILTTANNDLIDLWLDVDTFRLSSVKDEMKTAQNVTMTDVNRIAEVWKKEPLAQILVFGESKTDSKNQ